MRLIPIVLLVIVFVIITNTLRPEPEEIDFTILIPPIAFVVIILGAMLYITTAQQKKMYDSYTLHISDSMITRDQLNTPTIAISPIEVSEIILNYDKSFTIKSATTRNSIIVPAQIENYDEVKRLLGEIVPITAITKRSFVAKYQFLFSIVSLAMMATVYISFNKNLVAICGTGVIALLIYSFVATMRNNNIDSRARIARWFIWLVVASVAYTMYFKLTNDFPSNW